MGYGIFGQKSTGIRDIKTPPNGELLRDGIKIMTSSVKKKKNADNNKSPAEIEQNLTSLKTATNFENN